MLCLFFISIGTAFASDVNDNNNISFKNENNGNTQNSELSVISDNINGTSDSNNVNILSQSEVSDNESNVNNNAESESINESNSDINSSSELKTLAQVIDQTTNQTTNSTINSTVNTNTNSSGNQTINVTNNTTSKNVGSTNSSNSKNSNSNQNLAAAGDSKPSKLTQNQITAASYSVYKYIRANKKLPNYVTIAGYKFSMPEFMYLLSKTTVNKYKKITSSVAIKYGIKNPSKPSGSTIKAKMSKKQYAVLANNIANYIIKNNKVPNYASSSWGKIQYQTAIYGLTKVLAWSYVHNNKIPTSLSLTVSKSQALNKYVPKYSTGSSSSGSSKTKIPSSVLNSKYNGESLTKYLSSSKNCQSTSSTIKSLSNSLTKNCKTELEKATAIFNWVRDKVSYSFYYNTKKGAVKTLSSRSGNCVDKTHLLIALMRSAGIAAKYVHGKAKFSSGSVYGHVWAQVLVGDTWVVADTTSSRNSFGVVNNWNPKTATIYGSYSTLSF